MSGPLTLVPLIRTNLYSPFFFSISLLFDPRTEDTAGFDIVSRVYAMKLNNRIRSIFIKAEYNGNGVRVRAV